MSHTDNAYVTASNPAPGRVVPLPSSIPGVTGSMRDGGVGLNVYVAGGTGPGGAIPVTGTVTVEGIQVSGSFSIPLEAYPNSLENVEATRQRVRYDLSGTETNYVGYAPVGTTDASSGWTIKRISFDPGTGDLTAVEWSASGTAVWNDRTVEAYS